MKEVKGFVLMILFALSLSPQLLAQPVKNENKALVKVYYFHFTHRCATCKAVEAQSKNALKELYPERLEKGIITFESYNLDFPDGKAKGESLDVSGQTLLIVGGKKKINLTNEGFMYARGNPAKLKAIIKKKIDPFLPNS